MPKLSLIGAGPGDPELMTLKAVRVLQEADYILYDSLVNPKIFDVVANPCNDKLIFVGKRRGESHKQKEINEKILELLNQGFNVARLKGGDPFVFARAAEELDIAFENGFDIDIVPGLSSGLAVPVNAGFSLTLREKSEAIMMVTGHQLSAEKLENWKDFLNTGATLVIYMGLGKITEIVDSLKENFSNELSLVAIENGSLENQRIIDSNLDSLCQDLIDKSFKSPVIFLIGLNIRKYSLKSVIASHAVAWQSNSK